MERGPNHTHTHTHTHIYIYIYEEILGVSIVTEPASAGEDDETDSGITKDAKLLCFLKQSIPPL